MYRMLLLALLLSGLLYAQPPQSENFRIAKSVLDAGGAASSSASFHLYSAFGQPSPLGLQSSQNFILSGGYLSPMFSVSPLSPIQRLVIRQSVPDARLYWEHIADAQSYLIYRSTNPLFAPSPATQIGTSSDTSYVDVGAFDLPPLMHYYLITSSRDAASYSTKTNSAATKAPPRLLKKNR